MKYKRLSIKTLGEAADTLCAMLAGIGVIGFEIEDKADMLAFFDAHPEVYDYIDDELMNVADAGVFVKLYFEEDDNFIDEVCAYLKTLDKGVFGSLETSTALLEDTDWNEAWKQYFHVTPVGRNILIVPEWENPENVDGKVMFKVNPGQVFGTGTHESTKLCICLAEDFVNKGDRVADLGCGTGILGIVARLLGAGSAEFVDINEFSSEAVAHNCEINGLAPAKCRIGNILEDEVLIAELGCGYDVVFANIVSDVIIAAAPTMRKMGKTLIASGIIDTRADEVEAKLHAAGFETLKRLEERGWCAFAMK